MKKKLQGCAHNENGFAWMELIIVLAILLIISYVAIPKIITSVNNSRMTTDVTNARIIASTVEKIQNGKDAIGNIAGTYRFEANKVIPMEDANSNQTALASMLARELKEHKLVPKYKGAISTARSFILVINPDGSVEVSVIAEDPTNTSEFILYPKVDSKYTISN